MFFRRLHVPIVCLLSLSSSMVMAVDDSIETQEQIDRSSASAQARIDELDDQAKQDLQTYRNTMMRLESLEVYNGQMQRLVDSQEDEKEDIQRQIDEIDEIEMGALPLMIDMASALDELIESDAPFLRSERRDRAENLQALIDRADVSAGEKYRRILEAYQVEIEYGRTIEAYRDQLVIGDEPRAVEFLRLGRVGLYYRTLDGSRGGRWNARRDAWEQVDPRYLTMIRDGLRVARDQAPPELLNLPINAPEL